MNKTLQKFIAITIAAPFIAATLIFVAGMCLLVPFIVLIWPELLNEGVKS